ncbi:gamma-glutamyltransferase [Rubrivirga sp. IMCC43871]|uniref:gamma-glutamyltransferase n=1 Tax=Rubrivirga sp. IMCC43871 TaxID=3391575 RepID=UPI00398FE57E
MARLAPLLAALILTSACRAQRSPTSPPVRAENGMVVSAEVNASAAGVEVMRGGGNAVDAAVATGFALAVTFPVAGNVGGGGFMVIRFPDGTATTIDYRETGPAAATRDMFVDEAGAIQPELSRRGALASGVPGAVAGLLHAHETYGRAPLADVLAPAIRLAEGYPLSREEAELMNAYADRFAPYPGTVRHFTQPGGYAAGETFRQPELAAVLRRIRDEGRDGFYTGETARLIVAEQERGGGLITLDDLAGYQPVEREPLVGTYRGHRILSMPPPSSGGIALIQMLDAVEPFPVGGLGFNSSATVHLMGEAMRRSFADRARYLGDPDFADIPTAALVDPAYTARRMADFDPTRADSSTGVDGGLAESMQTTHYSVVDDEGTAVSVTTTLNGGFGSLVVVEGAGFFLNNEMDDFTSAPGQPNMFGLVQGEANAVRPGRRMLSSMTPAIVEDPEGRLRLVIGSPGGPRIITATYQAILNVIDHGMDIQEAVAAPRVHHQWLPDVLYYENQGLALDAVVALIERGWSVDESGGHWSRVDAIEVVYDEARSSTDPSGLDAVEAGTAGRLLLGGADPRGEDAAVGY